MRGRVEEEEEEDEGEVGRAAQKHDETQNVWWPFETCFIYKDSIGENRRASERWGVLDLTLNECLHHLQQ
jgi:hypothetical protein